ncbi:MAG: phosphoenolpyruvate carboxykinase (ATP) [Planctomycetota bacterium]
MQYCGIKTPASEHADKLAGDFGLENHGLEHLGRVYWNLPTAALVEEATFRGEGSLVHGGPFIVNTGKWSARAANDKYVVRESQNEERIWWGEYNRPCAPVQYYSLLNRMRAYLQGRDVWVQDCHVGTDPEYRMPIRVITDTAWQSHFARNMFLTTSDKELLRQHVPQFTMIACPGFKADPRVDGTRTDTAIVLNFAERLAFIANSSYGGEIKKSFFTILNYLLPLKGVMSMHCSANVGNDGNVALFFGLSGTGKTSLSADPKRKLIGDDEHGWSDQGVFNFEGGCYAKVIRLSAENEPQIYTTTHSFGTILENVVWDPTTRAIDLDDSHFTENTRASYPVSMIPNLVEEGYVRTHPKDVIFLTCDASGVLPPIARLDSNQAIYHFISGYTAKIAGTEIGLGTQPQVTFSACFGAPFMVHHPFFYANLLTKKMAQHNSRCWLVNTGWVGGRFGVGKRISIAHTRNLLNAALDGKLDAVKYRKDKIFGFEVPLTCPDVPEDVLEPANAWSDKDQYWNTYDSLAARYIENFKLFAKGCPPEVAAAGPRRLNQK